MSPDEDVLEIQESLLLPCGTCYRYRYIQSKRKKNTLVSTIGFNQFPHHRTHRLNLWAHLALNNRRQLESKMDGPLARTTVEIELAWN